MLMEQNSEQNEIQTETNFQNKNSFWISTWEFIKFTIIALVIIVPIRIWVAQPFIVNGQSMDPTFSDGDYLIVDEISYKFTEPKEGDVIIFRYPNNPSKFFIKRISGLPNQTLEINEKTIVLKDNEYFVLGDNSAVSSDSRMWGPVTENLIIGRAFLRLWPINKINILPGQNQ